MGCYSIVIWFYSVKICTLILKTSPYCFGWYRFTDFNCTAKKLLRCGSKTPLQRTSCGLNFLLQKKFLQHVSHRIQAQASHKKLQEVASLVWKMKFLGVHYFWAVLYNSSDWYVAIFTEKKGKTETPSKRLQAKGKMSTLPMGKDTNKVLLKSKLPVTSRFLCNKNRVMRYMILTARYKNHVA